MQGVDIGIFGLVIGIRDLQMHTYMGYHFGKHFLSKDTANIVAFMFNLHPAA